jgi:hypothetical protein
MAVLATIVSAAEPTQVFSRCTYVRKHDQATAAVAKMIIEAAKEGERRLIAFGVTACFEGI